MAESADRATDETVASEGTEGAEAPTCVVRYVEPMGAPRDAAQDTARSGRSVSKELVCDELLEPPTVPPKWASDIDTPCGIPRATATPQGATKQD